MNSKSIKWLAVAINLTVGNGILFLMLKNESLLFQALFHTVTSVIAILMLVILFRKITRNTKTPITIALALFGALSVPMLATFIVTAGLGIHDSTPDAIVKAGYIAIISGVSTWYFWVPFGIVNALLLCKCSHINTNGACQPTSGDSDLR